MVGWWTRICRNPGKKEEYTQTEIRIQQYSIEKYLWNRLQTTEAILPPPVNPPISVQLGAVRVDPATQYFSNPTHLYLDAFLLLSFFFFNFEQFQIISLSMITLRIACPRNALWRAILRRAILSTSFIRIARPIYFVFILSICPSNSLMC